jgi:hypothetical protein
MRPRRQARTQKRTTERSLARFGVAGQFVNDAVELGLHFSSSMVAEPVRNCPKVLHTGPRDVLDRLVVNCEQQKAPRMLDRPSGAQRAETSLRLRLCISVDPNYIVNISQMGLSSAELRNFHQPLPNQSAEMPTAIGGFHGFYIEMKNAMRPLPDTTLLQRQQIKDLIHKGYSRATRPRK